MISDKGTQHRVLEGLSRIIETVIPWYACWVYGLEMWAVDKHLLSWVQGKHGLCKGICVDLGWFYVNCKGSFCKHWIII